MDIVADWNGDALRGRPTRRSLPHDGGIVRPCRRACRGSRTRCSSNDALKYLENSAGFEIGVGPSVVVVDDAILQIKQTSVALLLGYTWSDGTLTYQGKSLSIEIDGLSFLALGVVRAKAMLLYVIYAPMTQVLKDCVGRVPLATLRHLRSDRRRERCLDRATGSDSR